ncbi:MAG: hypothetical protein IRY85_14260 [Micromonosporaceae bacterium]|nr:hypothetical protein [Micromonosporaceae bacterium]
MSVRSTELAGPRAARGAVQRPDAPVGCSCAAEASQLLAAVARDQMGAVSPSVYETARLVALGAWLPGHRTRIEYLLSTQKPDGSWSGPEAYALVPTLSATEALLGIVLEPSRLPSGMVARCVQAVDKGLASARAQLQSLRAADLPDTPAIEVIVPYLVARLHDGLARLRASDVSGLDAWRARVRLPLPRGLTDKTLRAVTAALANGTPAPLKVQHSLEVVGDLARGVRGVPRLALGAVGAAPAATVAWLGSPPVDRSGASTRYLRRVIAHYGGPVPCILPITNYERAWVVNSLALAGLTRPAPRQLGPRMLAALGPRGLPGGAGIPPDADTTAVTLTGLRRLGVEVRDTVLRRFYVGPHFYTWSGERTASPTTNAHVLTTLVEGATRRSAWRDEAIDRVTSWLCDTQGPDGFWLDKWHASEYYATACVVAGLRDAGAHTTSPRAAEVIDRAVAWVLASQRRNGSWGRWSGTAEETAYALQILLYKAPLDRRTRAAARRGYAFLVAAEGSDPVELWHGKDLYDAPHIVRAAVVGARHLAETTLGLTERGSAIRAIPRQRTILAG